MEDLTAAISPGQEGGKLPWHKDIRQLFIDEEPTEDLLEVARSIVTPGEGATLDFWAEALAKWLGGGGFAEDKQFGLLRGKMESVLVHGTPHAPGLLFKFYTTLGRATSILKHYKHLKEVELIDVLGTASFTTEAEAFGIRMSRLTSKEEDASTIVIFLKMKGNHVFAEDGGRVQSRKGGSKGSGKKDLPWNKWARDTSWGGAEAAQQ